GERRFGRFHIDAAAHRVGRVVRGRPPGAAVGVDGVAGDDAVGHRQRARLVDAASGQINAADARASVDDVAGNNAVRERPAGGRDAAARGWRWRTTGWGRRRRHGAGWTGQAAGWMGTPAGCRFPRQRGWTCTTGWRLTSCAGRPRPWWGVPARAG